MQSVETLIPDNEGNHLVVALNFYDEIDKMGTFQIPEEFAELDIADISINKIDLDKPLHLRAFFKMCQWLMEQIALYPNAVFSFICSTDPLDTHHSEIRPEEYRWLLFESFYSRNLPKLKDAEIESRDIIIGPEGCQTYARVFFRTKHAYIIHLVITHLQNKYMQ